MLRKGYQGFLAYVVNEENDSKLEDMPIVRDYSDVFPKGSTWLATRIMQMEFAVTIWEYLKNEYQGNEKV